MRARKVDDNQAEIVAVLRGGGLSVAVTSMVGDGFPDLVAGGFDRNYLIEIKDGAKSPSRRRLSPAEQAFHDAWRGQITTLESADDAIGFLRDVRLAATQR